MIAALRAWWDNKRNTDLPVLKEMPDHVRNLNIDGALVFLHVNGSDRKNPDVDATPWIATGKKRGKRRG